MVRWYGTPVSLALLLGVSMVMGMGVNDVTEEAWWKTATVYQIYPKSFKDSDGDGVGDLKGIIQMSGYLKELGVTAVWLVTVYESPMVDGGYDISNFTAIDPSFGTMQDFDDLVATFRKLDIKVLMEFVPNHSSDEHPWFQKSVQNDPDYADFYVWLDPRYVNGTIHPPNNWLSVFQTSAWEYNTQRKQYYLHQFSTKQPDLNFRNPYVRGNMTNFINFWLDRGVDGFRMDAVAHIYENGTFPDEPAVPGTSGTKYMELQHIYTTDQPETHVMLREWADLVYERVQRDGRPRVIILEVYGSTSIAMSYYGVGNQSLEFPFNFNLLSDRSIRAPDLRNQIYDYLNNLPSGAQHNWVLGNHDMIRAADRFGSEMVDAMNLLSGVMPGLKITYNGEEIGMRNTYLRFDQTVDTSGRVLGPSHYMEGSRDPQRTPFQWDASDSAGFSTNDTTWLPVNPNYWWLNVDAQRAANQSHLKVFKALMAARRDPVLRYGNVSVLAPDNDTLVAVRSYQGEYFALIINMGSKSRTYTSQNFFASLNLDLNMYVVIASANCDYSAGLSQQQGSLNFKLRPKAAVLLTAKTWTPSPSPKTTSPSPTPSPTSAPSTGHGLTAVSPLLAVAVLSLRALLEL